MEAFRGIEQLLMAPEDAEAYVKLTDPDERAAFLQDWFPKLEKYLQEVAVNPPPPRVDCDNRAEPPMPPVPYAENRDSLLKVKGMVDYPTAIAAWTLPGGYCPDDTLKSVAANFLSSYIYQTLDPDYDPYKQEREIEGFGCFADIDKQATILMCMVEKGSISKMTPEQILDKVGDALYLQWQPIDEISKRFIEGAFQRARLGYMSNVLNSTDNVASLGGRATIISSYAHYTGRPTYFSDTIASYNQVQLDPIRELAQKYITRDRMVGMVIEPMDEEERERLEANATEADKENNVASEHRAKDDRSRQLFDTEFLTPENIKSVVVVPDKEHIEEFTMDNGLKVLIMNHGEAPLVKVGLQVTGSDAMAPIYGLDWLAEEMYTTGKTSAQDPSQDPLAVAGMVYKDSDLVYASGSSGNLDALLYKARWQVEDYDWEMASKAQTIKKKKSAARGNGEEPETWASRLLAERLFPDHPYGKWMSPADYDALADQANLATLKDWVFTKWQPANAELVIVGKIDDIEQAKAWAEEYFGDWEYRGSGTPGSISPPPAPTTQPQRQVLLFDKSTATQSKVRLSCQLKKEGDQDNAMTAVLGEALTFLAFERLREEKGITYGAYAFPRLYPGNSAELVIASVVQNSGVGFAVQTMLDLVQEAADGELSDDFIATNKWNVARTLVSSQQSGDQMLSTLLRPGRESPDYYEHFPDDLANVSAASIAAATATCKGHEIVTVVGPVDRVEGQLKEAGIDYEVVDWEALYESELSKKELKKYRKAKAKAEKERADEETASGTGFAALSE